MTKKARNNTTNMKGVNSRFSNLIPPSGPGRIQKIKPDFEIPKATNKLERPHKARTVPINPRVTLSNIVINSLRVRVCLTQLMSKVNPMTIKKLIQ